MFPRLVIYFMNNNTVIIGLSNTITRCTTNLVYCELEGVEDDNDPSISEDCITTPVGTDHRKQEV